MYVSVHFLFLLALTLLLKSLQYIPQVDFSELQTLSPEKIAEIKKCGCLIIRNVVDDDDALRWKEDVKKYVEANPSIPG